MYGQNPYSQYPYTGYNYPNYGQRNYMQPQQQQMAQQQMQMQPQQPIMPTLCYAKMEEAKPYIITAPNTAMLFIDREKGKALLKNTDNVCNSHSRYFNIVETDEQGNLIQDQTQDQQPKIDLSQFVTVSQYNDLVEQFNALKGMLSQPKPKQPEIKPTTDGTRQPQPNTRQQQ